MGKSIIKEDTKIEHFADAYIKNGMNGTKAYQAVVTTVGPRTAEVQAHRLLSKDKTKKAIADRMPSDALLSNVIKEAITEKPKQDIDWSTKHKYIVTALKLKGYLKDEHNTSVNVGLFTSKD